MSKTYKVTISIIAVLILLFVTLNLTIPPFAKKIIVNTIEGNFKRRVSLKSVSITPALSVNLNNLEIENLFQADSISLSPNILAFLAGKVVLNRLTLINPVLTLEQSRSGKLNLPSFDSDQKSPPVYIASLALRNGRLMFTDKKVQESGFTVVLSRVNADISKVAFPVTSLEINFKVSADFLKNDQAKIGDFLLTGSVDLVRKNLDSRLSLRNLDITYFSPYYGTFISEKKLLSANLNIQSVFKSINNDLDILTNFKLSNLTYAIDLDEAPGTPSLSLAKNALDLFTDREGNLILEFKIKTKFDNPSISIAELKKVILQAAVMNIARQNPEDLIKKVSDNIEQFKEFGKEMERIFKGKQ